MEYEGLDGIRSVIHRLEGKHGTAKGDLDLAILGDGDITFEDGSYLQVSEAGDEDGNSRYGPNAEQIFEVLFYPNPAQKK